MTLKFKGTAMHIKKKKKKKKSHTSSYVQKTIYTNFEVKKVKCKSYHSALLLNEAIL